MQPLLVLTLELVIQHDAIDARTALGQPLRLTHVRAKHLAVVFDFARLLQLRIERLLALFAVVVTVIVGVVATMRFQHASARLREHYDGIPMSVEALCSNESLFAEMAQIT